MAIRSQRQHHACLHRVQAAQLSELEKSKRNTPDRDRAQEVLPLRAAATLRTGRPANGRWPTRLSAERRAPSARCPEQESEQAAAVASARGHGRQQPSARRLEPGPRARRRSAPAFRGLQALRPASRWAELKKVEWPGQIAGDPGHRRRDHRLRDRRPTYLCLGRRRSSAVRRPTDPAPQGSHVPLVRDQHLLGAREQGEGQSRAPDRSR